MVLKIPSGKGKKNQPVRTTSNTENTTTKSETSNKVGFVLGRSAVKEQPPAFVSEHKTSETKQAKQELPLYDSYLSPKDVQAFANIQGSGEGIDITQIQQIADEAFDEAKKTKYILSAYNACRNAYNNALRKKTKAAKQMNAIRAEMRRRAIWNNYKAVVQQKKEGGTSLIRYPKSLAQELSGLRPKG